MSAPLADGVLAANFNGDPDVMSFAELQAVKASWVRGFFLMPDADKGDLADQPVIKAQLAAARSGYGTVLCLMFPYFDQPIPTSGSPAMAQAQQRLDAVLPVVMSKIDILVIGNEPFIDCREADRNSDRLNAFYEAMAQRALDFRARNSGSGSNTQLFMGALNNLEKPSWRTAATERWMAFVRGTSEVAGTDIHPHLSDPGDGHYYLDYVLPRMRPDQKFLATEFSLVGFFKKHLADPVGADYAARYRLAPQTPVWQVVSDALANPVSQQQWNDFLAMSPWFAENKGFMTKQMNSFRATGKLAVAGYGLGQDTAMSSGQFTRNSMPWVLNSIFCQHTVQPAANGLPGRNIVWATQFSSLQRA